jgi:hypothetical protein
MSVSSDVVPEKLESAYSRLLFPPSYVIVGVYRLLSDSTLRIAAWNKCKHGTVRGAVVGFVWVSLLSLLLYTPIDWKHA